MTPVATMLRSVASLKEEVERYHPSHNNYYCIVERMYCDPATPTTC